MDHLTVEKRSCNMSRITSRNTKPEMIVRSMLHEMGFRFRLHGAARAAIKKTIYAGNLDFLKKPYQKQINPDLSLESCWCRTIPLKHAHVARLRSQLNRAAPAAPIARVRLRNFCIRKRPSFLASRRFAPGYPNTFLTIYSG